MRWIGARGSEAEVQSTETTIRGREERTNTDHAQGHGVVIVVVDEDETTMNRIEQIVD